MVLGLLCVAMLVMLLFMKTSLGSDDAPDSTYTRVARKLVWAVATSQYLCGFDRVYTVYVTCMYNNYSVNFNLIVCLQSLKPSNFFIFSLSVRNALVVVAASLVAFSWNAYGNQVFTITGETSQGLPPFRLPPTSDITANGTIVSFGEIVEVRSRVSRKF